MVADNIVFVAPKVPLDPRKEQLVDLFCGGGGSGSGILDAYALLGRDVQGTFVNHWDKAIELHQLNHPAHRHFEEDLFLLKPQKAFPKQNARVRIQWCSPSCQQFSISRGNKPINEQGRTHADTVVQWVEYTSPDTVLVENVKEFLDWGPLRQRRDKSTKELQWAREVPGKKKGTTSVKPFHKLPKEHLRADNEVEAEWELRMLALGYARHLEPDPAGKGDYFRAWRDKICALGYDFEYRLLVSCSYGDPTIRKRFFGQFVRKSSGLKIVWPNPTHAKPDKDGRVPEGMEKWVTAEDILDLDDIGESVFSRKKRLVKATMRRLAIGLVKHSLGEFLVPSQAGFNKDATRGICEPVQTIRTESRGEGIAVPRLRSIITPSNKGWTDNANVRPVELPIPSLTAHSRGNGIGNAKAFVLPKDQGHHHDYVRALDAPCSAAQTTANDSLISPLTAFITPNFGEREGQTPRTQSLGAPAATVTSHGAGGISRPFVAQLNGQSTAQGVEDPVTALTGMQKHYVAHPFLCHMRGKPAPGVTDDVSTPVRALTAGGQHLALAEALVMTIDNAGKAGTKDRMYPIDEPVRTLPTKANQAAVRFTLRELEDCIRLTTPDEADASRVIDLLEPLMEELKKAGRADIKPWVYTYYSSGSEGSEIGSPVPTARCKANLAVCYPVLEFDGHYLLLDVFYRMFTLKELARVQGFSDDYKWDGLTKTEAIKAIGNSVSRGVAESLTLAVLTQDPDIGKYRNGRRKSVYDKADVLGESGV